MSLKDFLTLLFESDDAVDKAHELDIIDKYYYEHPDETVLRKDAARILHLYMLKVLHMKDEEDISSASVLKDLYDCRVCVNHIAQVYLKGILKAREYPGKLLIFDSNSELTASEAEEAILNMKG